MGSCARVCVCWRWVVGGGGEWWYGQRWWWVRLLGRRRGGDVLTLGDLGIIFCGLRGGVVVCRRVIGRSFARGCECHVVVPGRLASYAAARSRAGSGSSGHRTCHSHSATTTCPTTPLSSLAGMHTMAWTMRGRLFVSVLGVRQFGSQRIPDPFSPNTAEFLAAAGSVSSIPRLMGLPEVGRLFTVILTRCTSSERLL